MKWYYFHIFQYILAMLPSHGHLKLYLRSKYVFNDKKVHDTKTSSRFVQTIVTEPMWYKHIEIAVATERLVSRYLIYTLVIQCANLMTLSMHWLCERLSYKLSNSGRDANQLVLSSKRFKTKQANCDKKSIQIDLFFKKNQVLCIVFENLRIEQRFSELRSKNSSEISLVVVQTVQF